MTKGKVIQWWAYVILTIALWTFLAPAMISQSDTIVVLLGVVLLTMHGVWTYYFWAKPLFLHLIKEANRES
jgi:Sec-independent protein secretion pathway component TatC